MMRKKLLCLLIAANATLMASATITKRTDYTAIVEGSTPVEGIRYVFNQESLTATVATIDSLMPDSIMHIPETVTYEGNTYMVTAIGDNAFGYSGAVFSSADQTWISVLQGLKKIIVPKTVKRIGAGAFHNTGWKGNTVPTGKYSKNSPLEGIYFEEGSQLEEVGENALGGPSASTSNINHLVTKVVFPDGMKAIPARCFYNCENLRSITLPASVESIGEEAFWHINRVKYDSYNSAITSFNVNLSINSLVEIGSNAFGGYVQFNNESSSTDKKDLAISVKNVLANILMGNKTVTQVVLSAGVEHIGSNAFANSAVSSISCQAVTPPTVDDGALPSAFTVGVPYNSYEAYLQAEAWKDFLVGEWTFADNGVIDGEYRKLLYSTSYTLTYPDHVAIKECDMHGSAVLLADSVEYEGHKFAVQPEIPEGIFYDRLAESYSVNNYLERIVINTPVTRLPNMICDKDNNNKYLYLDESYGVCMSALKSIQLPETLEEIGDSAFFKMVILRNSYYGRGRVSERSIEVNIPKNVKRIGDAAFCGVPLTNMNLPKGLKSVGKKAFFNHFADEISLPASVEQIGEDAFYTEASYGGYGKPCEVSHITVASGNQHFKVEDDALYTADGKRLLLCTNQKNGYFNLPEGLSLIDEHALGYTEFTGMSIPASVTLPNLLKLIPTGNMSSIDVAEGNPVYKSIDGVLFNHAVDTLLRFPPMKQMEEYTVPASVLVLGESSMSRTLLKKVNLPNTLREMREYALAYNSFKEIRLPDSLRYMYGYALGECNGLRSITVPDSVRWRALESYSGISYRGGVIGGCENLRTVRFSGYMRYVSPSFISGHLSNESGNRNGNDIYQIADRETCDSLQKLYSYTYELVKLVYEDDYAQMDGVEYYRERPGKATAINTLPTVKPQLTVPEKIDIKGEKCVVNKVTNSAFRNNSDIVSLSLSAKVDTIGYLDSTYVSYLDEVSGEYKRCYKHFVNSENAFAGMSQLKSFSLNKSAAHRVIGASMFAYCPKLESITWPDGVDSLGMGAFIGDSMLVNLNFTFAPELKEVPDRTFMYCTSLKSINLPNIYAIGNGAFAYCEQLADITIAEGTNDISLGQVSFFGCKELTKLPAAERLQWAGDAYYNPLETCLKLPDYAPETIGTMCLESSNISEKTVTYVKDHLMLRDSYSINENDTVLRFRYAISYPAGCTDKSYAIPDGVMVLNPGAFSHSQFENLTIPASVAYVNYGGFAFNHQLKKIEMMSEIPPSLNILYPEEMNNVFIEEGHVLYPYISYSYSSGTSYIHIDFQYAYCLPFEQDVFDNATLYVPEGAVEAYRNSEWNMFRNILSIEEPTGINTIESQPSNHHSVVYDMQGRRVKRNNLQKGLYIVDGKKVMMR